MCFVVELWHACGAHAYVAPQDNQCECHTQVCGACATTRVCLAGSCVANCVLDKKKKGIGELRF